MRTSIAEIIATERFLRGESAVGERLVFEARLLVDRDLQRNTRLHRLVHRLITLYHRRKRKAELERLHTRLVKDPSNSTLRAAVKQFKY